MIISFHKRKILRLNKRHTCTDKHTNTTTQTHIHTHSVTNKYLHANKHTRTEMKTHTHSVTNKYLYTINTYTHRDAHIIHTDTQNVHSGSSSPPLNIPMLSV